VLERNIVNLPRDHVALCRHGRRTRLVEHQRQLAESDAARCLHDGALALHCDVARAGANHVELIALVALLDDLLTRLELDSIHGFHQRRSVFNRELFHENIGFECFCDNGLRCGGLIVHWWQPDLLVP